VFQTWIGARILGNHNGGYALFDHDKRRNHGANA
jgi:hypothetical protein